MAEEHGLELVRAQTRTGYKGVRRVAGATSKSFRAKASRLSAKKHGHLGDFGTAAWSSSADENGNYLQPVLFGIEPVEEIVPTE